ncbi:glycosyltransferase family 87 protein [Nocardia jejuensis]|uniref:glycosyltransferase family 87 protein n=1 Tax=Nocardia jejuensis TaxID=328049 RepID=UPI000A7C7552|nr:glycosyltransferase family 87 protein [Nocardia jejuensis]
MITMRTGQRSLPRRTKTDGPTRLPRIPIAVGILLAVALTLLFSQLNGFLDLQVYRVVTQAWLHGGELYGPTLPVRGHTDLPFTYPPFAALLMIPLAVVPLWLAEFLVTASSLGCLGLTIWLVLSRVRPDLDPSRKATFTATALALLLAIEPVRITMWFGQINLVLMAAVALDCLTEKPRWPRGLLIGAAAVVKLTPAAFVLFFLIRKDWKAAGIAAATSAGVVLSGFLLFPTESRQYWLHAVTDTSRIGSPDYVGNQSIKGMIFRLGLPHSAATAIWLVLSVAVVAVGAALMHHLVSAAQTPRPDSAIPPASAFPVVALLVNAAVLLLVSPVSWTHHWVWAAPALVTAAAWKSSHSGAAPYAAIATFAALFLIGPGLVPNGKHRELAWHWWQHIPGDIYILAAIALLITGLTHLIRHRTRPRTEVRLG